MIINFLTLIIGSITYLRELILLGLGRKVVKSTSRLLVSLVVFLYITSLFIIDGYLIILLAILLLLSYLLIKYFLGTQYRIQVSNMEKLEKEVKEVLKSTYQKSPNVVKKDKLIKLKFEDNKSIILKEMEGWTDRKCEYYIIFRRWGLFESKKEIIDSIADSLKEDEYERNGIKTAVKFGVFIIIAMYLAGFYSNILIEEEVNLNPAISQDFPEEIYITSINSLYSDEEILKKLQEILSQSWGLKYKARLSEEEIKEMAEFIIEFKYSKRILYIGNRSEIYTPEIYVFVHGSEVGDISILHNIAWQVFRIYNKENGYYYPVHLPMELNDELKALLKDIR